MGFSCGLLGLPNAGKTTLFNALSLRKAKVASHPFTTIDSNIARVSVPDRRLDALNSILHPEIVTPTVLEIRDIAGLVKGASKGEGLGNKFLADLREVDALLHVVRCFEDEGVPHIYTTLDILRDADIVTAELAIADMEVVERRLERVKREMKGGDKKIIQEYEALSRAKEALSRGCPIRLAGLSAEELSALAPLNLLTQKPLVYVANIDEKEISPDARFVPILQRRAEDDKTPPCIVVLAKLEEELGDLEGERMKFLKDLGIEESGLDKLIRTGYELLGLITFYTIVGKELRAWAVPRGSTALKAAGKIHTDMEKGFIKAEVIGVEDFIKIGSEAVARERGLVRVEGRDYIVQDAEILHIRFH